MTIKIPGKLFLGAVLSVLLFAQKFSPTINVPSPYTIGTQFEATGSGWKPLSEIDIGIEGPSSQGVITWADANGNFDAILTFGLGLPAGQYTVTAVQRIKKYETISVSTAMEITL